MKSSVIDVCHETIQDETDESLVVSINVVSDDDFEMRINLNYHEELSILQAAIVDEMMKQPDAKNFFIEVVDRYYEQLES